MSPTDPVEPDQGYRSYYGTPVLKQPEWTWEVPWYLFAGGMGGAASALGFLARVTGREQLADRAALVAAAAAAVSPVLLVKDLGRPSRFYNMLRVFKPTSAMSVGSWILGAYSTAVGASTGLRVLGRLPRVRRVAEGAGALLGLPMTTYTGVLVADSSIPVWHEARTELPALFAASGAASAGAALLLITPAGEAGPARRLAVGAAAAELALDRVMEERLGEIGEVYDTGDAGRYGRAAKGLTAAGALLVAAGGRRRWASAGGAAMILAGSACLRWSVFRAGFQSAADPKYVVKPQRERLQRGEGHRRDPAR
jgi:hypothetical protein